VVNIQATEVRGGLDVLDVSPPNTDLPSIDEKTINWVLNLDPGFISPNWFFTFTAALSINGAVQAVALDTPGDWATAYHIRNGDVAIDDNEQQYVIGGAELRGGATTPIQVIMGVRVEPIGLLAIARGLMTNPGFYTWGPFFCPSGAGFEMSTTVNGGVGDTVTFRAYGVTGTNGIKIADMPSFGAINQPLV